MVLKERQKTRQVLDRFKRKLATYDRLLGADAPEQARIQELQAAIQLVEQKLAALELREQPEGILPTVVTLGDYSKLVIHHWGTLAVEGEALPRPFTINNEPYATVAVPPNSKGTIRIQSLWVYDQRLPQGNHWENSRMGYLFTYHYEADDQGIIYLQALETHHALNEWNPMTALFVLEPVTTNVGSSDLTIQGSISESKDFLSTQEDRARQLLLQVISKIKTSSWTVGVRLKVGQAASESIAPTMKELVFEKENQAVLSSDETKHLQEWWDQLHAKLKLAVETQKAIIVVEGYTSETGTHNYNLSLGKDRADYVRDQLHMIIGDIDGRNIAIIKTKSLGETKENKRYVKITVAGK